MSPSKPQPPTTARAAALLIWAGAALALIGGVLTPFLQRDAIRQQIEQSTYYAEDVDRMLNTFVTIAVVSALIGCGLWVWMAIMNGKGRNWARITATVFAGLNIAGSAIGLAVGATFSGMPTVTTLQVVLSVCSMLIAASVIVLMWLGESSRWYKVMGDARRAARGYVQMVPAAQGYAVSGYPAPQGQQQSPPPYPPAQP